MMTTVDRISECYAVLRMKVKGLWPQEQALKELTALAMAKHTPVNEGLRRVRKIEGSFQHTGTVVSEFKTLAGETRMVVEFDPPVGGLLHVYRPDQLESIIKAG